MGVAVVYSQEVSGGGGLEYASGRSRYYRQAAAINSGQAALTLTGGDFQFRQPDPGRAVVAGLRAPG